MKQKGRYINGRYVVYRPTQKEIQRANDFHRPQEIESRDNFYWFKEIETGRNKTNENGNGIKPVDNGKSNRGFKGDI